MPELPEVETVRRGLATYVPGRTIRSVAVLNERAVRRHLAGAADFSARLTGRTVTDVSRRGKYLWFVLDDGTFIVGHLGMSGQLLLPDPELNDSPHLRVRVTFTEADPDSRVAEPTRELHFVDQRTFGGLLLSDASEVRSGVEVPAPIAHIAADPLEPGFDDGVFARRLALRRTGIKRALLDQTLVSGIGNIYADEALWRARLHYDRLTSSLRPSQVAGLLAAVRAVLGDAVQAGGTSFDSLYVDVNGQSGWFARDLDAYGRGGQPCRRCSTPIRRDHFMNRSSYSCPRCQRRPRATRSAS
jgi:formamidopyrimidine-DNA glycosylase